MGSGSARRPSGRVLRAVPAAAVWLGMALAVSAGVPSPSAAGADDLAARAEEALRDGRHFDAIAAYEEAVRTAPERLDIRFRLADLLRHKGFWVRSAEQYKAVLAAEPEHVPARLGYAELLLAEYQFRPAADEFRRALDLNLEVRERDRALVGLGNSQFGMEDYRGALETYRLILARKPDDPSALAFANIALKKLGDLDAAVEGWRRYLAKHPDNSRARVLLSEAEGLRSRIVRQKQEAAAKSGSAGSQRLLGDLLVEQPDLSGAVEAYRAALAAEPENAETRFALGIALRDAGRFAEGVKEFKALLDDASFGMLAAHNLAYCARRANDADAERRAWRTAVEANPRDAYAYRRFVATLTSREDLEREAALLGAAVKSRPADSLPRAQYGMLALASGLRDEALRALVDALTVEPNDPLAQGELHAELALHPESAASLLREIEGSAAPGEDPALGPLRMGAVLLAAGMPQEAEKLLAEAARLRPASPRAAVALAVCRRSLGAPLESVVESLRNARDLDPDYLYGHLDLAMALHSGQRFEEAAVEAEAVLHRAKDDPRALTILGSSLRSLGGTENLEKAHRALKRALEVDPMDGLGAARLLLAKVSWELGRETEARTALRGALPVEPETLYRLAWESVRDNYHDRTFNGQDWRAWRDRFAGRIQSRADAHAAIALMLASLDDRDTRLRSADQTASVFFTPRSAGIQRDRTGRTTTSSRTVETAVLEGNVGYVAVSNMFDPKLVGDVKSALGEMKEKDAVILDLRGNPGGTEKEVDQVTSMLVPRGTPTGKVVTPTGVLPMTSTGAAPPVMPDKPLVVLVDRNTASSAEALAGALKESRRAVIVGEQSFGKAGIQVPRLLPDGTTILVAAAESGDLAGKSYSKVGVRPDVTVEGAAPSDDRGRDAAILKAREILAKERLRSRSAPSKAQQP